MKIKTEKTSVTLNHLRVWLPENITINDAHKILKEERITAYHMWTRNPMYVSIMYKNNADLEKAKLFVKIVRKLSKEREEN
jgi:hypothetical protein